MKGVIYARYSSDNQREESIEGQVRECKAFAEKNDIQIVETYIDRALSARTDRRPDFQRMIKDSSGKKFEVVIVWKLDRFARDKYDSAHYKRILKNNGVKVVSATEAISAGAEGILLESMLEGMAEYYSAELSEKVTRGLTENALKCKYNGGTLPIGYMIDSEQYFQIDPLTAPAVLDAFKHYADGASMREITNEMNLKGVRTKRGGKISINSVTRMLHNRKYIGEYKYNDIVQQGGIPAIVPEDLFNCVQERMIANKKVPAKHKAEDEYLLTTKLFCGKCQCYMVGESGTGRNKVHRYYKCASVKNHKGCDKKTVKKEWIENLVIKQIKKLIFDDELIEKLADTVMKLQSKENTVLPLLKKRFADTQKSIDNMLDAIQQGILTASTKERLESLEKQKSELSVQIVKEEMAKPTLSREQIIFWFHRFRKLNTKRLDHRRRLIDSFVNAIFLYDDRITFTFNYKDGTKTINFTELEKSGLGSDINALAAPIGMFLKDFSSLRTFFFTFKIVYIIFLVATIFVPKTPSIITSPIFTGAQTLFALIRLITSKILSFGTGLAVLTLTMVSSRFSTRTDDVTVRVGLVHSSMAYCLPFGQPLPVTVILSVNFNFERAATRADYTGHIPCHFTSSRPTVISFSAKANFSGFNTIFSISPGAAFSRTAVASTLSPELTMYLTLPNGCVTRKNNATSFFSSAFILCGRT